MTDALISPNQRADPGGNPAMTMRQQYEAALREWSFAIADLRTAIADFMEDGLQTSGGTWLLTMSQTRAEALHAARRRADVARSALDRILDDLLTPQGRRHSN